MQNVYYLNGRWPQFQGKSSITSTTFIINYSIRDWAAAKPSSGYASHGVLSGWLIQWAKLTAPKSNRFLIMFLTNIQLLLQSIQVTQFLKHFTCITCAWFFKHVTEIISWLMSHLLLYFLVTSSLTLSLSMTSFCWGILLWFECPFHSYLISKFFTPSNIYATP